MRHTSLPVPSLRAALPLLLCLALWAAAWGLPGASPAAAQGGGDLQQGFDAPLPGAGGKTQGDSLEGGFEAPLPGSPAGGESAAETPSPWSLDGFLRLDGAYNFAHDPPAVPGQTDYRGWSKLRLALRLEVAYDFAEDWKAYVSGQAFRDAIYQLKGEEHYTPQVLDAYQQEGEIREAWVRGTPVPNLDLKVGRQIVVWGKSDNLRVADVLNPVDEREPGLTDLEDLRIPVTMSRVDYYVGDWGLQAVAVHEIRFNKEPVYGSDFYPTCWTPGNPSACAAAGTFPAQVTDTVPTHGGRNTEYGASLSGIFTGWDLAFYWAEVFDDFGYIVPDVDNNPFNGFQPVRYHPRVHMAGAAANVALGNWLLKGETAHFDGLRFNSVPGRSFRRLDGLLGVEYSPSTDTTVTLEGVGRRVLDYDSALRDFPALADEQAEVTAEYALSYRASFLRETVDVVAVILAFGGRADEGTVQRYQVTYELARALDVTGGVVIYTPGGGGNTLLANAKDNDRLFFETKWSF